LIVLGVGGYFWLCNKNGEGTEDKTSIAETGQDNESEILGCYLDEISYEKNAKIVELEYSETTLVLKWGRNGKYTESNVSLDPTTLIIESENVKSQYNNSLLVFTDKTPGESVIFSISTSDKSKIYRYQFNIKNAEEKGGLSIPKGTISQQDSKREDPKKAAPKKEEIVAKVDTVYVQFEYDKLEKGSKLLLNYSAKPTLIFNKKEEKVKSPVLGEVLDGLTYDDLYWNKDSKKGQFSFTFKGESSDSQHILVIPCSVKDSEDQVIISVKLVPKKKENGNVTPIEEKKKDNNIELQSA